jgi:hypothetical protein
VAEKRSQAQEHNKRSAPRGANLRTFSLAVSRSAVKNRETRHVPVLRHFCLDTWESSPSKTQLMTLVSLETK